MKRKKLNRIKPISRSSVVEYFDSRDEFINFDSRGVYETPVEFNFHRRNYKESVSDEQVESTKPTANANFRSKRCKQIRKWKPLKVLNIIGYLAITVGCMYQCFSFLAIYFKYPTTVELNVENEAVLDFPAVTVCNSNPVKYKIWCEEDKDLCTRKFNETIEQYRQRQDDQYDRMGKERRIKLGYRLEEFVVFADYEDLTVIDTFQQYYDFEFTNCYTFNAAWGYYPPIKKAIVFNPVTGKSSELVLCVNMDVENYSNNSGTNVARTRMTIHANDVIPNPTYDAASLEAGSIYSYGIQKVSTHLLKYPYQTNCRNYEEEREYRTGARMSQKNCFLECFKTEMEKLCGCTYRRLALMYDAKACEEAFQYECLDDQDRIFTICNPQCPMACKKDEFAYVATDSEPLRQESDLYKKKDIRKLFPTQEEMNKNMACMRIHYGSTETKTLSHRAKYPFIELFSLLGGFIGLWLGFSFLSGYDIGLMVLLDYLLKRKLQRKQRSKVFQRRRRRYY